MQQVRRLGIRTKLIIIYLLIAIPLIILLGVSFYERYRADQIAVINERSDIARLAASNFDLFIDQVISTQANAGDTIVDEKLGVAGANRLLSRIASSKRTVGVIRDRPSPTSNITFMDKNGVIIAASLKKTIGENRGDRPAVRAVMNGANSAVGNLQVNADGTLGFMITSGIRRGGSLVGIMSTSIKADQLAETLGVAVSQGGVNIVDASGHLIFQSQVSGLPLAKRDWSNQQFVETALKGKTFTSTGIIFPLDGSLRMGVEISIRNIGWVAGSFVLVESVLSPIRNAVISSAVISLIVLIFALALAFLIGNRFAANLIILKNHMQSTSRTGFGEHVTIQSGDEIEDLANSFNQMQDEILAAQTKQRALQHEIEQRNKELAELYERQKNLASILQESLLPEIVRKTDHLEIGLEFQSATEAALVGGDFFDFFEIAENRFGIIIGDVSGKGIEAATLASRIRNTIRDFAYDEPSPARVVERVNKIAVIETLPTLFVTLFFGILDVGINRFIYANAGHWPPIVFSKTDARVYELEAGDLPVGAFSTATYKDHTTTLPIDSITVLFTDGVIEAKHGEELFGTKRLGQVIQDHASLPPDNLAQTIIDKAKEFGGGRLNDDAAVLVFRIK